jgi:protein-tyrosine phosphatase
MRIDFHSHILPQMDDGARSIKESLALLDMLKDDKVDVVVATPHLYLHRDSVSRFLDRREKCANELFKAIEGKDYPKIIIGAEIYFTNSINNLPLEKLCIGDTDFIMVELPYNVFSRTFLNTFADFVNSCEYNIILAHIERYYDYNQADYVDEIFEHDVIMQVNTDSFETIRGRRLLTKFIKNDTVHILGTDLHSVDVRPPTFGAAERFIRKKISDEAFERMMAAAEKILGTGT